MLIVNPPKEEIIEGKEKVVQKKNILDFNDL